MNKPFTASEVRDLAKRGTDAMQQFIDGCHTLHVPPQHDDADMVIAECLRAMDAFADRLEADGAAEPVAYAEFADNGCVRVWSREYEERLPGTRMVPLYTHSAQARPAAARVADEYQEIARLIGSIFCAGEFKAETWNEKELERLLKKTGNWFDNVDQVPKPFLAAQENPQ